MKTTSAILFLSTAVTYGPAVPIPSAPKAPTAPSVVAAETTPQRRSLSGTPPHAGAIYARSGDLFRPRTFVKTHIYGRYEFRNSGCSSSKSPTRTFRLALIETLSLFASYSYNFPRGVGGFPRTRPAQASAECF